MDIQGLLGVLSATVNPAIGNEALQQAELQLQEIEKVPGYLPTLLQIVADPSVPVELKHASVLRFKNLINQNWRYAAENDKTFSDEDQELVRTNIFETIVNQNIPAVRVQLCESVFYICHRDFPDRWPTLLPQVASGFQGGDLSRAYASVSVLYQIFKRYRHKVDEKAETVDQLVQDIFPVLLQVFQHFAPMDSIESIEMCRMVAKSFRVVNEFHLPPLLQASKVINEWVGTFIMYMQKPEPQELQGKDADERINHPYWKCIKTISKLIVRLYQRYGQTEYCDEDYTKFAKAFSKDQAPRLQELFFGLLENQASGAFMSDRVLNYCFQFMSVALTQAPLFKNMKKKLDFLLFQSVFGCLSLKQADIELWTEDPHEFINRETDITTEFHDPRVGATNLLIDLVRTRTAQTLDRTLSYVAQMLNEYSANPSSPPEIIKKEVALRAIGALSELLMKKEEYKEPLEEMLITQVIPELQSTNGFLRARACWTLYRFAEFSFTDEATYVSVVQGVFNCLSDAELPVKMEACGAITAIIQHASVLEPFRPLIPSILDAFFKVIDEIGNEDILVLFDSLIEKFGDEISPYAGQLVARMMAIFMSLVHADLDDDDSICTAMSCMRAANTVLHSLHKLPHMYSALEPVVIPAIEAVLEAQAMDFFDDVLEMITCFTYYPKVISEYMWTLLPRLLSAFDEYATDYISSMIHPIDNYICLGTERFLATKEPNLVEGVLNICSKFLTVEGMEVEAQFTAKMCEALLSSCVGHIDQYYSGIFRMVMQKLHTCKTLTLKFLLLNAVAAAAYYNPRLFLSECVATDSTVSVFNVWLSHCTEMKSDFQRRVAVLGLGSLCQVPLAEQPQELASNFHNILLMMMQLLEQRAESDSDDEDEDADDDDLDEDDEDEEDEDEEDDDPRNHFNEVDDDEDVVEESDVEYLKLLAEKMKNGFAAGDNSAVSDSDFESKLDDINHFIYWATAMQSFSQLNPEAFHAWTSSLTPEQSTELQKWSDKASEEKAREEQEAADAASGAASPQ